MDTTVFHHKRTSSALDWDNGWVSKPVYHPETTSLVASDSRLIPSLNWEDRALVTMGDHVHALPYHTEVHEAVVPSLAGRIEKAAYQNVGPHGPSFDQPIWVPGQDITQRIAVLEGNFGHYAPWSLPALPETSEAELGFLKVAADTKALAGVRRAAVNLPLIIKERRETLSMITHRVASVTRAAHDIQEQSLREWLATPRSKRRSLADKTANTHLEVVFGWMPLLADVEAIAKQLQAEKLNHIKTRGTHGLEDTTPDRSVTRTDFPGAQGWLVTQVERRGRLRTRTSVRTSLRYDIEENWNHAMNQNGFAPLEFLYDSYPLSFVSGWVSNFDHWLRTLTPTFGLKFVTGSRSVRREAVFEGDAFSLTTINEDWPLARVNTEPGKYHLRKCRWDREVLYAPPTAEFQFQNNFSWFSITAGLSLLVQRYNKPLARALRKKSWKVNTSVYTE